MFFQLILAYLIPNFLRLLHQPEFYFSYFWPLKHDYLFPTTVSWLLDTPGALGKFMVFWAAMMSFIATPILTYYFGKRWYCSWVCGCGGLANTFGAPWRHLSDHSRRAWRLERILIDAGVIGVGFYPLFGTRVWCRFGCPMAALLGLLQKYASRFRITTNGGQCMSCGNCSTYCEMGIDVRWYSQKVKNIIRASCVGCGLCAYVCPRGVLNLEAGPRKDRYNEPGNLIDERSA